MLDIKRNTTAWVPVRLLDGAIPVAGVVFGDVQAAVFKADGVETAITVGSGDWDEATTGALSGTGSYRLRINSSHMDVLGFLIYVVAISSPATKFVGSIQVVENLESDTYSKINADIQPMLQRALGLMHENSVLDQTVFDGNNLASARLRVYDTKANANSAGVTGLVGTYTVTAVYSGKFLQNYKVVREP